MISQISAVFGNSSLNKIIGYSFGFCCLIFVGLGIYTVQMVLKLDQLAEDYVNETNMTVAMNADVEDLFEARLASWQFRATNDEAYHATVAENISEILEESPMDAFLGQDETTDRLIATNKQQLREFLSSYQLLATEAATLDEIVAEIEDRGPKARQLLTEFRESAVAQFEMAIATQAGVAQESLLLGRYYLAKYIDRTTPELFNTALTYFERASREIGGLETANTTEERRELASQARAHVKAILEVLPQLEASRTQTEMIINGTLNSVGAKVTADAEDLLDQILSDQQQVENQMQHIFSQSIVLLPIIAIVSTLVVIAIAVLISGYVRGRFGQIVQTTEALSKGDLDVEIKDAEKTNEFGRLAKALQVFRSGEMERKAQAEREAVQQAEIANLVKNLSEGLERLSEGDLTTRIDVHFEGEFALLRDNFNNSLEQLQSILKEVITTSQAISNGSDSLASAATDLATRTEQQAAALAETTVTISQIKESVDSTANSAQSANTMVVSTQELAENGEKIVEKTVAAMTEIEKGSSEISQIIGTIDDIAFQTNLLALNAGVEAARAGDAGRGFAVVASEVRALAQRAGEAAKEIKDLIETSQQKVGSGVKLSAGASEALRKITEQVAEVSGTVSKIDEETRAQATGISEISIAMTDLDRLTQQNAAMVEETTAASVELKTDVSELQNNASIFKVESQFLREKPYAVAS